MIGPHELAEVYVQVTSTYPPLIEGGVDGALLVNTPVLHPPLTVVEAKNEAHAAFTCACVRHEGTVTLFPQLNVTAGAAVTVKRFVQVNEPWFPVPQPVC